MSGLAFRFVHGADFHLGAPISLRSTPPGWSSLLETLDNRLLERFTEVCCQEAADFVLLAGDIFDSSHPSLRVQRLFVQAMERLDQAGVDCFLIEGNHDAGVWEHFAFSLPNNVHRFGTDLTGVRIRVRQETVAIWGVSFAEDRRETSVLNSFPPTLEDPWNTVLFHAEHGSGGRYHPYLHRDLAASPFAYHALGHEHVFRHRMKPDVVYPGTPQVRNSGEPAAAGICVVDVADQKQRISPVSIEVLRWQVEDVVIDGLDEDEIFQRCEEILQQLREHDLPPRVVRLRLVGTSPLHAKWVGAEQQNDFLEALREETRLNSDVWLDSLEYAGWPDVNLPSLVAREDFLGSVARELDNLDALPAIKRLAEQFDVPVDWSAVTEDARRKLLAAFADQIDGDDGLVD